MMRVQFEHAVRAAAGVVGEDRVLVIGSQAIHASITGDPPESAMRSVEVDIVLFDDPDGVKADLVDGSIGEASVFHDTFGFYAQGVSIETALLPESWRDRLVRFETPNTAGVVAWCLSPADLWVSKALAGRPKDLEFCRSLLALEIVEPEELSRLVASVEAHEAKKTLAMSLLAGDEAGS